MSYLSQHNEIRKRLYDAWGSTTPIAWPNKEFTPPNPQAPWIRLSINDGEANQINLGSTPSTIRYFGIIYFQVFVVQDKGDTQALTLADQLISYFHNWCGVNVRCRAAKVKIVGNSDGWFQVNVSVPFYRDEQI